MRGLQCFAERFAKERHEIGRQGDTYMVRYVLAGQRFGAGCKVFLHHILRSDYVGALHDHPWPFWSLIVAGGYWEWTELAEGALIPRGARTMANPQGDRPLLGTWYSPGSLLRRPVAWKHRVEITPGRDCWSLLWIGAKERSWGFWCRSGLVNWRNFDDVAGCGEN